MKGIRSQPLTPKILSTHWSTPGTQWLRLWNRPAPLKGPQLFKTSLNYQICKTNATKRRKTWMKSKWTCLLRGPLLLSCVRGAMSQGWDRTGLSVRILLIRTSPFSMAVRFRCVQRGARPVSQWMRHALRLCACQWALVSTQGCSARWLAERLTCRETQRVMHPCETSQKNPDD